MTEDDPIAQTINEVLAAHEDRSAALDELYQRFENAGVISRVTVHRFVCTRGCGVVATVIKVGDLVLVRTRDYKLSPGLNAASSVQSARDSRTLDGNRHWPKFTLDLEEMATWAGAQQVPVNCRHRRDTLDPREVLRLVADVEPGHPGAPTKW